MTTPSVSILLPVRNEARDIDSCLESLEGQDYQGRIQIVAADGRSDDSTGERLDAWKDRLDLVVVDNPARVQADGLNLAADLADGEILIRADGHTVYPADYVRRNVEALLATSAVAVGGLMRAVGDTPFSRAVAAAMGTPLAIGPGRFHHATAAIDTDTVYLGAFRKSDFQRLGSYRSYPSQVAEDADLYYRWRKAGESIRLDPAIESSYRPRRSIGGLWRQAFRWGAGKAEMLYTNGELPYLRPLIPLSLVLGLIGGLALGGVFGVWWPLIVISAAWGSVLVLGAIMARHPGVVVAAATMHVAYGVGLIGGLLKGRRRSLPLR